jgi:hypothetical protein
VDFEAVWSTATKKDNLKGERRPAPSPLQQGTSIQVSSGFQSGLEHSDKNENLKGERRPARARCNRAEG